MFYSGNILRRKIFVNVSKISQRLRNTGIIGNTLLMEVFLWTQERSPRRMRAPRPNHIRAMYSAFVVLLFY